MPAAALCLFCRMVHFGGEKLIAKAMALLTLSSLEKSLEFKPLKLSYARPARNYGALSSYQHQAGDIHTAGA